MKLLKAKEVAARTSFSIPHIHRLAREGKFQSQLRLAKVEMVWAEDDVNNWIQKCVRSHSAIREEKDV